MASIVARSILCVTSLHIEEETDRREGKGRRCCLGDGIIAIPCRTTDLAPGCFEENYEKKHGRLAEWMLLKNR